MNRTARISSLLAAAWLCCAVAPVHGQEPHRYLGGGVGLLAPSGTFGDVDKTGWHLVLTAMGTLKGAAGFVVDGVYGRTAHQNGVEGSSTLAGIAVNAALFLGGERRAIRPFVMGGIGAFRVNVDVSGFGSAADTKLGLEGGGGLLLGSGSRHGFVIARYLTVRTSPQRTPFIPVSAGVIFPISFP